MDDFNTLLTDRGAIIGGVLLAAAIVAGLIVAFLVWR